MRPAQLRETVQLQRRAVTRSASGGETVTWTTFATRRASVAGISGKEYFTARQENAEVTHRIRLRYDSLAAQLTPVHRVLYDGRLFDIESVIDYAERHRELILMCRRQASLAVDRGIALEEGTGLVLLEEGGFVLQEEG